MELVWATHSFLIAGRSYAGFPILLWDSMASCEPANDFLRHYLLRGTIGSTQSWASTGRALYDFFSFIDAHELDWREVDFGEAKSLVAGYRDYCLYTCKLTPNTTSQRLSYICSFYEYALRNGWIKCLPFALEERRVPRETGFLGHVETSGGKSIARDVMPRREKTLIKFLTMGEIKSLLAAAENPHHRMMIRMALQTGLRREEIATFPVSYIVNPEKVTGNQRNLRIYLDPYDGSGMVTKGNKPRQIIVSRKFMAELYRYVIKVRGERSSLTTNLERPLFLNQVGVPYKTGGKSLNRIISNTGKKARIKVHMHMLRHTYATHLLVSLQRNRESGLDPLVFVQRQLGHSSIQTTMKYLHLVDEMADDVVLAYDDDLNSVADAV